MAEFSEDELYNIAVNEAQKTYQEALDLLDK